MKHRIALVLLALAGACHVTQPPPVSGADCAAACARAASLECGWARPTPQGASCIQVCAAVQASGVVAWNLDCRASASSCAAMDDCERK